MKNTQFENVFFYLLSTLQIRFVTFNKTDLLLQITKSQACFSIGRAHIPALKIPLHMFIQCIIYTVERILSSGTPTNKLEEACSWQEPLAQWRKAFQLKLQVQAVRLFIFKLGEEKSVKS